MLRNNGAVSSWRRFFAGVMMLALVLTGCKKPGNIGSYESVRKGNGNASAVQTNNREENQQERRATTETTVSSKAARFITNEKILIPGGKYKLNPQIIVNTDGSALIPVEEGFLYTRNIYADEVVFETYTIEYTVTDDMRKLFWSCAEYEYYYKGARNIEDFEKYLQQDELYWKIYITPALVFSFAKAGVYTVFYKTMFFTLDAEKSIDRNKKHIRFYPDIVIDSSTIKNLQDPDIYRYTSSFKNEKNEIMLVYYNVARNSKIAISEKQWELFDLTIEDTNISYSRYGFDELKPTKYGRLFIMGAHTIVDDEPESEEVYDYKLAVGRVDPDNNFVIDVTWNSPKLLHEDNDVVRSVSLPMLIGLGTDGPDIDCMVDITFPLCSGDLYS